MLLRRRSSKTESVCMLYVLSQKTASVTGLQACIRAVMFRTDWNCIHSLRATGLYLAQMGRSRITANIEYCYMAGLLRLAEAAAK